MQISQQQFADAIRAAGRAIGEPNNCTKRLVQKWESGEHSGCKPNYLRVLQVVTGLSARELGFRVLPNESGESAEFRDGAGSTGGGHSIIEGTPGAATQPTRPRTAEFNPDTVVRESMDRIRHALEHPSAVDSRTADFVETATARLFNLEHHSPARSLTPTLDRHLATVTVLLSVARHDGVRRRLMISSGYTALLAACLAFDRGDNPSAQRLWDSSIDAAESTANEPLLAASLTFQSYAAARRKDLETAWELAHDASTRTPGDDRATAWATARVALYAAQLGEHEAAETAMKQSMDNGAHLPRPKPGDGTKPWMRSFDLARLLSSTALTAALLNEPSAADYATQAVDALSPARSKSHAVVLAEAALTAAIVGEFELCLDYGSAAATLTRRLQVSIAADVLHEIVPILMPHSDTRAVQQLLPQLTPLTRTADLEDETAHGEATHEGLR